MWCISPLHLRSGLRPTCARAEGQASFRLLAVGQKAGPSFRQAAWGVGGAPDSGDKGQSPSPKPDSTDRAPARRTDGSEGGLRERPDAAATSRRAGWVAKTSARRCRVGPWARASAWRRLGLCAAVRGQAF